MADVLEYQAEQLAQQEPERVASNPAMDAAYHYHQTAAALQAPPLMRYSNYNHFQPPNMYQNRRPRRHVPYRYTAQRPFQQQQPHQFRVADSSVNGHRIDTWVQNLCSTAASVLETDRLEPVAERSIRRYIEYVVQYNAGIMADHRSPFMFETLMRMTESFMRNSKRYRVFDFVHFDRPTRMLSYVFDFTILQKTPDEQAHTQRTSASEPAIRNNETDEQLLQPLEMPTNETENSEI